ncbi:MAG: hypothetical protein IJ800_02080 [Clostridia bacterium]|nr:hypothetical protein [Clostridia bacterium]
MKCELIILGLVGLALCGCAKKSLPPPPPPPVSPKPCGGCYYKRYEGNCGF